MNPTVGVSLSTWCGVHLRPNDGRDRSLYL